MHVTRFSLRIEYELPTRGNLDSALKADLQVLAAFELPDKCLYNLDRTGSITADNFENTSTVVVHDGSMSWLSYLLYSPTTPQSVCGASEQKEGQPTTTVRLTPFISTENSSVAHYSLCSYSGRVVFSKKVFVEGGVREDIEIRDYLA